jgi:hypothetical protein
MGAESSQSPHNTKKQRRQRQCPRNSTNLSPQIGQVGIGNGYSFGSALVGWSTEEEISIFVTTFGDCQDN